ncbi:MAG TPA: hypothetical protein VHX14_04645 [Thermoanaerobaculia bacterium]|jgi:hypothetical protein|nr:hypothetical protein [Thermoanaerobaculia bacterium]
MASSRKKTSSPRKSSKREQHEAEQDVDHYKFWILNRLGFSRTLDTRGQFDFAPRSRTTIALDFIGNPVAKDGVPVQFPERHLTGYTLEPPIPTVPEPHRRVVFSNQFTQHSEWHIGDPQLLLLPAGKSFPEQIPPSPKPPATHYLCYQVRMGDVIDREVQLQDQFDDVIGAPEIEGPLFPAYFGVPVEKNGEPIGNPDVHLAIYRFQPRTGLSSPIYIRTSDQFLPLLPILLSVQGPTMLAVPSTKLDWNEEP